MKRPTIPVTVERILLRAVVGSRAYGLDTAESDTDMAGVFRAPTDLFLGLDIPSNHNSSITGTHPDSQLHEVGKFLRLVAKANPTLTELLWLDTYEVLTPEAQSMIDIRHTLLGHRDVQNAYFGYAKVQFHKIENREDDPTPKRLAKHARHMLRLLDQGTQLFVTGHLDVRVSDPQRYFDFGAAVAAGNLDLARQELERAGDTFHTARSPLPEYADIRPADDTLRQIRKAP